MTLDEIRARIDDIDDRVVAALEERAELALLARRRKAATFDGGREAAVLARLSRAAGPILGADFVVGLYRAIMAESRAIQDRAPPLAGYVAGREDARAAALLAAPGAAPIRFAGTAALLEALREGLVDAAVLPADEVPVVLGRGLSVRRELAAAPGARFSLIVAG